MTANMIGSQHQVGTGRGQFRRRVLHLGVVAGVILVVTLFVAYSSASASARRGTNAADEVRFFQGVKTCHQNTVPPLIECTLTTSNVPLLQGATIAYVSVPPTFGDPAPGRIDSDIVLTTAVTTNGEPSTALGHCTFYFATGTGLCTYTHGTNSLAGFQATLVIGTIDASAGTYAAIGKYWFESDNGN